MEAHGVMPAGATAGVLEWADQRTPPEFRDEMRVEVDELRGRLDGLQVSPTVGWSGI
jgi:hypothetical protein